MEQKKTKCRSFQDFWVFFVYCLCRIKKDQSLMTKVKNIYFVVLSDQSREECISFIILPLLVVVMLVSMKINSRKITYATKKILANFDGDN